jgi:hypothetical protein
VHQNDNAMTLTSREKPAANRRARITPKLYCASLQIRREVSNSRFRGAVSIVTAIHDGRDDRKHRGAGGK